MKNLVNNYVKRFLHERRTRRRLAGILMVLAVAVVTGVFWQLHSTGVALVNETYCGLTEHQHDEDCYETVLICEKEEADPVKGHEHDASCYETEKVLVCDLEENEEHTHTDACYETEQVLTCEREESEPEKGHKHDDSCYEEVLVCDLPEHVHSVACMSDENADLETADEWEATIPANLSGVWADDVVAVAQSQIGYAESEKNFQYDEESDTSRGYTRYGAWYGSPYGDWCAMFSSFCLNYAGVPESEFPEAAGVYAWTVELEERGLYADAGDYTPKAGDLIFFDPDETGKADHVGIVEEVETEVREAADEDGEPETETDGKDAEEETKDDADETETESDEEETETGSVEEEAENGNIEETEGTESQADDAEEIEEVAVRIKTIEGNCDDAVCENTYAPDDVRIVGYGILPEQPDKEAAEDGPEEADEDDLMTLVYEGEDYTVTVTYGPEAKLPEDVELVVGEYEDDSEAYQERIAEAAEFCETEEDSLEDVRLFHISLMAEETEIDQEEAELTEETEDEQTEEDPEVEEKVLVEVEPAAEVEVTIALAGQEEAQTYTVIHFSDETQKLESQSYFEENVRSVFFTTDTFSDFMVLADLMPLAARQNELEIFKYDTSQGSGYLEGYYVWVPNGTYRVVYDTAQNEVEDGTFFYIESERFQSIAGEENWYEADYHGQSWQQTWKDEDEGATSSHGSAATVVVDGTTVDPSGETDQMGSYVYVKYDDNIYHYEFDLYLILDEDAPIWLNGDDLRDYDHIYKFEEYEFESTDEMGALSGATFTLHADRSGTDNGTNFVGYVYFTDNGDGSYTFAGVCDEYDSETGAPIGVVGDYTCFITSGTDGSINIDGLPSTWIEFTLHEVSAPEGYEIMDDVHISWIYDAGILDDDASDDDLNYAGGTVSIANDPTEEIASSVKIYKYSSVSGTPLSGAQFILSREVEETDDEGTTETRTEYAQFSQDAEGNYSILEWVSDKGMASHLTSDEDGYIYIVLLHTGTYTLTETTPPEGYVLPENPDTTLVVGASDVDLSIDNDAGDNLEILKYADVDGEKVGLSGAEFVLSRTVEEVDEVTKEPTGKIITEYAVLEDGELSWTTEESEASSLTSDTDGYISISYPGAGGYTLTETKAPDGYMLLESEVSFTIDASGKTEMTGGNSAVKVKEDGTIAIENVAGTELPSTGGRGTWMYILAGLALMCGAAYLLIRHRREDVRA